MNEIPNPAAGFVALVTIDVDGEATQRKLVDMLSEDVEGWVRHCPGFLSANYHLSNDGTRVVNYAEWVSIQAYRESFDHSPDKEKMRQAIRDLDGVLAGPSMTGYTLTHRITAPTNESGDSETDGGGATTEAEVAETADTLRKLIMRLGRRLREERPPALQAQSEVGALVLVYLSEYGPSAVADLALRQQAPPPAVRKAIDELTAAGLVEPALPDRLRITAVGEELLENVRRARVEWLSSGMTGSLTSREREVLRAAVPLLARIASR